MRVELSNRFLKDYKRLDSKIQDKVEAAIIAISKDRFYAGLRTKKVQGVPRSINKEIWEARVDGSFRLTYHIEDDSLILRRCGTHQIYKNP